MHIRARAMNEMALTENRIRVMKSRLRSLPAGRIECIRQGDNWKWYCVKNGRRKYLSKKYDCKLANRLAYKRKIQLEIDYMEKYLEALNDFIRKIDPERIGVPADRRARKNPEVARLAFEYERSTSKALKFVDEECNNSENKYEDQYLTVPSKTGRMVRSKSEAIIDSALHDHGLQYCYEKQMRIGKMRCLPDFAIRNPKDDTIVIWEHFGMMDDPDYVENNLKKMMNYINEGYIPNNNFIVTFESRKNPLDAQLVEMLIEKFFE